MERKETMKKSTQKDYRRQVNRYFEMELSDLPLTQVLLGLPELHREKVRKVIRLHYRIKKPPADAAVYIMRVLRGPCKSLIVGQKEEREWSD
jgi:hypothetical protein